MASLPAVAGYLGVAESSIDQLVAIETVYSSFINLAIGLAEHVGIGNIRRHFDHVVATHGFDDDALWDVLFDQGAKGFVVAKEIAEDDTLAQASAQRIAELGGVVDLVALPDPDAPGTVEQQVHDLMVESTLYTVAYGEGPVQELAAVLVSVDPELRAAETSGHWVLGDGVMWCGLENDAGAALVVFYVSGEDGQIGSTGQRVLSALENAPSPWKAGRGSVGAMVPSAAAPILQKHGVLPADQYDVLSELGELRARVRQALLAIGCDRVGPRYYRAVASGHTAERTQLVLLEVTDTLTLFSPVAQGAFDVVPDWAAEQDVGRFTFCTLDGEFLGLTTSVPLALDLEPARTEIMALADYADQWEQHLNPGADNL
ncbi:MAG TPA: hypothetical protein DHV14_02450 [Micrococcales bacterium]|uniref:hypothetical protein n=1 Tax=Miniimonas arenae TaxID=676201 RepID=UPI000ED76079|nr:hypothetical protein [Miniimonas arenae]HCX84001.1 hypothetical protein [Micrococcales bacterium]